MKIFITNFKNSAFTLAETLIVIGIIGVVAALTLPNLNHATGDKETVTRVKKAQSTLVDAHERAVVIYGDLSGWPNSCGGSENMTSCYLNRIGEFLKVSKKCSDVEADEENGVEASNCNAMVAGDIGYDGTVLQLADGLTVSAINWNNNCGTVSSTTEPYCLMLLIDIDGAQKGKNEAGRDQFLYGVFENKGVALELSQNETPEDGLRFCLSNGLWCTWWVNTFGNLDYLKVEGNVDNGEGGTSTSTKCQNSNIVLNGTTNTSCH